MFLYVNSIKKNMKKFFFLLFLLNGCSAELGLMNIHTGIFSGGADVAIKSDELLTSNKCKWRCYDKNTLSRLEKRLDRLFGQ
ncbi:hypothetical protein OAB59_02820 [Pelagibacteraceae bacterium]|jgi:hypothetical protein|nr:hypothetical protein [Pelagibacteraceae bacterium]